MHGVTRSKEITDALVHTTFTRYWSANYTKVTDVWHSCYGGSWVLKVQQTEARSTELRVSS